MAEPKKPTKKIIDVQHPGKSAPSPSAKPVIVTNRPVLKDPMVVDSSEKAEPAPVDKDSQPAGAPTVSPVAESSSEDTSTVIVKKSKPKLSPTKTIAELAEDAASEDEVKSDEDKASEPAQTEVDPDDNSAEDESPKPTADKPSDDTKKPEEGSLKTSDSTDSDDETDESKNTDKATAEIDAAAAEEAKKQAELEKLAASKKYYLPINAVEHRRNKRALVVGIVLSLLLVLAWADIALDAGLIEINGVKPVTHFFSS